MQQEVTDTTGVSVGHKEPPELAYKKEEHPMSSVQGPVSSSRSVLNTIRKEKALPPWRDSDRLPKDIIRFNYLDNLDPLEQALTV